MKLTGERTITDKEMVDVVNKIQSKEMSKGAGIRELFAGGLSVQEISKATGIRYNHVYNVTHNEVLVHDLEVEKTGRESGNTKKAMILNMLASGKTIVEVAKETRTLYNQVWQIAKLNGFTGKKAEQVTEPEVEVKSSKRAKNVVGE